MTNPTTVRLSEERQARLRKMARLQDASNTEILGMAIDYLWEDLGPFAEELAREQQRISANKAMQSARAAHTATARLEGEDDE